MDRELEKEEIRTGFPNFFSGYGKKNRVHGNLFRMFNPRRAAEVP